MSFRSFCAALTALTIGGWAATANSTVVDFNTAGDLTANYNVTNPTPPAVLPFGEADAVGIGNPASRGLSVFGTIDSGAVYKVGGMPFASVGDQVTVSGFFRTAATFGTTGEDRILELNVVGLSTNIPTAAHTGIGAKIEFPSADGDNVLIRFRQNNGDVGSSLSATEFDILPNTWYKATFTATNQGALNAIPASMVLDSYGTDGTALVSANVYSHSFNIPAAVTTIAADAEVFGAFRIRNGTRLINAFDHFEQLSIPVPEPATWLLGAMAGCALFAVRRVKN